MRAPARTRSAGARLDAAILERLAASDRPVKAYGLLSILAGAQQRTIYPNQIYRALDRLIRAGMVVRVESGSGYLPTEGSEGVVLLCSVCGAATIAEASALHERLEAHAGSMGFEVGRTVLEAIGVCPTCAAKSNSSEAVSNEGEITRTKIMTTIDRSLTPASSGHSSASQPQQGDAEFSRCQLAGQASPFRVTADVVGPPR